MRYIRKFTGIGIGCCKVPGRKNKCLVYIEGNTETVIGTVKNEKLFVKAVDEILKYQFYDQTGGGRVMTAQDKDRIECAIRHIQTAVDVDPWAVDIAVEAMEKQMPKKPIRIDKNKEFDGNWKKVCPLCGRMLIERITTSESSYPRHYNYTGHCWCGQAIDWEEGEVE